MITIKEHKSSSYAPRTYHNASIADITIAVAVDYTTAGEKLTHKAAGDKYLALPIEDTWIDNARLLWHWIYPLDSRIINVAGNSIYTLKRQRITQDAVNKYLLNVLEIVHKHTPIDKIISGGQTGVDIAGAWAGHKLGIPVCVTLPKGLIQRHEDCNDREHTYEEIMKQIVGD